MTMTRLKRDVFRVMAALNRFCSKDLPDAGIGGRTVQLSRTALLTDAQLDGLPACLRQMACQRPAKSDW